MSIPFFKERYNFMKLYMGISKAMAFIVGRDETSNLVKELIFTHTLTHTHKIFVQRFYGECKVLFSSLMAA